MLGRFEYALLCVLVALGPGATGRAVRIELEKRSARRVTHGAAYSVLSRLERRELVESWFGTQTPERGGRRPKHYALTAQGVRTLARAHGELERVSAGLVAGLDRLAGER